MLFELSRFSGLYGFEQVLLSDVIIHENYLEANLISNTRCEELGECFYVQRNDPQKFLAMGPLALVEFKGRVVDARISE